jgi:hypothetical protein
VLRLRTTGISHRGSSAKSKSFKVGTAPSSA